jgi:hypothetical protein
MLQNNYHGDTRMPAGPGFATASPVVLRYILMYQANVLRVIMISENRCFFR